MYIASAFRNSANPVVWMRAVLMDLGFGGLIEKFEEYLGRGVTTVLLIVLALLVFTWALSKWLEFLVASQLAVQQGGGSTWWDQAQYIAAMAVPALVIFLLFRTSLRRSRRDHEETLDRMTAEFEEGLKQQVEDFSAQIAAHSASDLQQLRDLIGEARAAIEAANKADDAR